MRPLVHALSARIALPSMTPLALALMIGCASEGDPPGRQVGAHVDKPLAPIASFDLDAGAPSPSAAPSADPDDLEDRETPLDPSGPKLVAIAMETYVQARPSHRSTRLGYLRAGAKVVRAADPSGSDGCTGGWYRIAPRGFVCAGKSASLDDKDPIGEAAVPGPHRGEAYPYRYVISRSPPPQLYVRLPSVDDQHRIEGRSVDGAAMNEWARAELKWLGPPDPISAFLQGGRDLPKPFGAEERVRFPLHRGRAKPKSAFGVMATYEWTGRRFGLTTELDLIPIDRTHVVRPSRMHGFVLGLAGPPAFVVHGGARAYERLAPGKFKPAGLAEYRSGWVLTGKGDGVTIEEAQRGAPAGYLETTAGVWLPAQGLKVGVLGVDTWGFAKKGKKWIDVSIERQILIAYEGERPVYATLVSTGRGKLADPKTTSATVQGVFFVQSKHVSTTMDGSGGAASHDLHDVPYVQYFQGNYALHGAYWHDEYGKVMSSGCVNLAPADAAWLFDWTDPVVPAGWHGASNPAGGTLIYVHP